MKHTLCNASMAVKCQYKRNVKPHVACGFDQPCINQVPLNLEEHGSNLMKATEAF